MKLNKKVISMFSVGILATGFSFAAVSEIKGVIESRYAIKINEEDAVLPSDLKVLNYNNTTYVPLRFLSENIGVDVEFIQETGIIELESKLKPDMDLILQIEKLIKENDELKYKLEKANEPIYKSLPISTIDEYSMNFNLNLIRSYSNSAVFSINIKNDTNNRTVILDPYDAMLIVDGVEYNTVEVSNNQLLSTIAANRTATGDITFYDLDQEVTKGILRLKYRVDNSIEKEIDIYFDNNK